MTTVTSPRFIQPEKKSEDSTAHQPMETDVPSPAVTNADAFSMQLPVGGLLQGAQETTVQQPELGPTPFRKPKQQRQFRARGRNQSANDDDEADSNLQQFLATRQKESKPGRQERPKTFLESVLETNFPRSVNVFGAITLQGCFNDVEQDFDARSVLVALMNAAMDDEMAVRVVITFVGASRGRGIPWHVLAQLLDAGRLAAYAPDGLDTLMRHLQDYGSPALCHYSREQIQALDMGAVNVGQQYFTQRNLHQDGSLSGCHLASHWADMQRSLRNVRLLNSGTIDGKSVQLFEYWCDRGRRLKTVFQDINAGNALLWQARCLGVRRGLFEAGEWAVTVVINDGVVNGPLAVDVKFRGPALIHIT